MSIGVWAIALLGAALVCGCSSSVEPIVDCEAAGRVRPICGLHNPEDLVVLPGGKLLLVSQFGSIDGSRPGSLAALDVASESLEPLFPAAAAGGLPDVAAGPLWGDPGCAPPGESFNPHGIDLTTRSDGALQLLVVNHGGRESVEFFEVLLDGSRARLAWRGCALPPDESFLNDVVALPDGGFLATHMLPKDSRFLPLLKGLVGLDTGYVLEWQPGVGFREMPGTAAPFPNGIEISPDAESIYLNVYLGDEVRRIARKSGELLGVAEVPRPDNSTWAPDGRLLVASHTASVGEMLACGEIEQGSCPFEFQIVALDPETLAAEVLFRNAGPPMGAGTVAVRLGDELFIGTYAGDRVARVALAQ
jgi:hypothetical protein